MSLSRGGLGFTPERWPPSGFVPRRSGGGSPCPLTVTRNAVPTRSHGPAGPGIPSTGGHSTVPSWGLSPGLGTSAGISRVTAGRVLPAGFGAAGGCPRRRGTGDTAGDPWVSGLVPEEAAWWGPCGPGGTVPTTPVPSAPELSLTPCLSFPAGQGGWGLAGRDVPRVTRVTSHERAEVRGVTPALAGPSRPLPALVSANEAQGCWKPPPRHCPPPLRCSLGAVTGVTSPPWGHEVTVLGTPRAATWVGFGLAMEGGGLCCVSVCPCVCVPRGCHHALSPFPTAGFQGHPEVSPSCGTGWQCHGKPLAVGTGATCLGDCVVGPSGAGWAVMGTSGYPWGPGGCWWQ